MTDPHVRAPVKNWAGNVQFNSESLRRPTSVEELQQRIADTHNVHALGTAHSFSTVADTVGDLISVAGLPKILIKNYADAE